MPRSAAPSAPRTRPQYRSLAEAASSLRPPGVVEGSLEERIALLAEFSVHGLWTCALALLAQLRLRTVEPPVVAASASVLACQKRAFWRQAIKLLGDAEERALQPQMAAFNAALVACEQGRGCRLRWQRTLEVLRAMRRRRWRAATEIASGKAEGCLRGVGNPAMGTAIRACQRHQQWCHAVQLLMELPAEGLDLDSAAFETTVSACGRGRDWAAAVQVLRHCKDVDAYSRGRSSSFRSGLANVDVQHAAMTACTSSTRWSMALSLFGAMLLSQEANAATLRLALAATAAGGLWSMALWLLSFYLELPSEEPTDVLEAYESALTSCENAGQWQRALYLLTQMQNRARRQVKSSIQAIRRHSWPSERRSAPARGDRDLLEPHLHAEAFGHARAKKTPVWSTRPQPVHHEAMEWWQRALQLLEQMRQKALEPDPATYNAAVAACRAAGLTELASDLELEAACGVQRSPSD